MSATVDIGAARVRLIVDSTDFDPAIQQGRNAVKAFGTDAQNAYDKSSKSIQNAANKLLDYVSGLGRADTQMDRLVRNASRMGVEKTIIDAATAAWQKHNDEMQLSEYLRAKDEAAVKKAIAGYKELIRVQEEEQAQAQATLEARAKMIAGASSAQFAENAQRDFSTLVGVSESNAAEISRRRADAEAAFLPILQQEAAILEQQLETEKEINLARSQQHAENVQQDFNKLLGIPEQQQALTLARRRADAEAAFLPIIEAEDRAIREAFSHNANIDSFIRQLENIEATAGKDYYALLQLKAAELGVSQQAGPMIERIKAANAGISAGTITAKQYQFALRGLPAQFTDIFTSLAAGQNPLLVLLQQGGQIKDMFGGIGSAVKAVGVELLKVATNPLVLSAAAIATVAAAIYQAESRVTSFAIASAKGNGIAGTAQQLSMLAEQLNSLSNIRIGTADEAIQNLAASGLLYGKNFELAAEASARWASVTGEAVDDVAGKFTQIAKDPLSAVIDGTVKLTEKQYEQLHALELVGDKQSEVALVTKAYYDQINTQSAKVAENIGYIGQAWRGLKDDITSAAHEAAGFFDFIAGAATKAQGNEKLPLALRIFSYGQSFAEQLQNLNPPGSQGITTPTVAGASTGGKDIKTLTADQIKANQALQAAWDQSGTEAEKSAAKVRQLQASLRYASDEMLKAKGIFKDAQGGFSGPGWDRLVKAITDKQRQGPDPTASIKAWEKSALEALKGVEQATLYSYQDQLLTVEDYYAKLRGYAADERDIELESIAKQIKALSGRRDSEDKILALTQQAAEVRTKYANDIAGYDRDEVLGVRARQQAWEDYAKTLQRSSEQLAMGFEQAVRGVGLGSEDAQQQNQLQNRLEQYKKAIEDINEAQNYNKIDQATADKQRADQYASLITDQQTIIKGYADMSAAQADWSNGASKAWADWVNNVNNSSQTIGKFMTEALDGVSTALATFIRTGKLSVTDLLDTLQQEILEFIVKSQIANLGKALLGQGGSLGGLGSIFVGAFGGAAAGGSAVASSATSLSSTSAFGNLGVLAASAHGNAFGGGSLAAYRNSIVSQPTMFPFARGGVPNIGLMGERAGGSSEAIMPLTRTSGGDLAVRAVQSSNKPNVNLNQTWVVQGKVDRQTQLQLLQKNGRETQRALSRI